MHNDDETQAKHWGTDVFQPLGVKKQVELLIAFAEHVREENAALRSVLAELIEDPTSHTTLARARALLAPPHPL